jgi:hypothetical protein
MASLHPSHGARIVLEREAIEDHGARYRVSIYEPSAMHSTEVRIHESGVDFGEWTGVPPAWAVTFLERTLKGMAKKHADGSWPRKLTRWREERG